MVELWQRLEAPLPNANEPGTKPHHVFGGAMLGLKPEGWAAIDPLFTVAYMGAAEYEFGELPKTLQRVYQNTADYHKHHDEKAGIFYICQDEHLKELQDCVKKAAKGKLLVKNDANFDNPDVIGWIDINRRAFIFKDKEACEKTCEMFGVK